MPARKKSKPLEQDEPTYSDTVARAESASIIPAASRSRESKEEHNVRSHVETGMRPDHFQKGNQPNVKHKKKK